jgi:hypothetical protein
MPSQTISKEVKPKAADPDIEKYLAALEKPGLRADACKLIDVFTNASGQEPQMWGTSIIAFGSYDYKYESGRTGSAPRIGFAVRKNGLVIYIGQGFDRLSREVESIGPHTSGKSCIYLKSLENIDLGAMNVLAVKALALIDARYPPA